MSSKNIPVYAGKSETEVFERVRSTLIEMFNLAPEKVIREARLQEDLDIDSIDVIDLLVKLEEELGRDIASRDFSSIRTVGHISQALHQTLQEKSDMQTAT